MYVYEGGITLRTYLDCGYKFRHAHMDVSLPKPVFIHNEEKTMKQSAQPILAGLKAQLAVALQCS